MLTVIFFLKSEEYIKKKRKEAITLGKNQKIKKIKISKNKKFHFLRVTSRVLCPNFKSLAQTVSPVAMTHTHTHTHTHIVTDQTLRKSFFTSDFLYQCFVLIGLVWK